MVPHRRLIPLASPWMGEEEIEALQRVIASGWIYQGPVVQKFERKFADYVGAKYACAVSSCTTALHLALIVAGVQPGDEVITVSHSFIATSNSIRYCGAVPVFTDIQAETFNIAPELIEDLITERTRVILCVHQMGMPCDLKSIIDVACRHSLKVVEDAACAAGSEILWKDKWERIGKPHGDVACFSFHPRKVLTTGEGGMITTSNREWDEQFHLLRQHGMSVSTNQRHSANEVIFESYPVLGYNYRMTDIQAAIGLEQLKRLPQMVKQRRLLAERYRQFLEDVVGVRLPEEPAWALSNWQSYCVGLPDVSDQREVMQYLLDRGVASRRGVMCVHREVPYADVSNPCLLHESEKAQDHSIILPLFHQMSLEDQDYVVKVLKEACCTT